MPPSERSVRKLGSTCKSKASRATTTSRRRTGFISSLRARGMAVHQVAPSRPLFTSNIVHQINVTTFESYTSKYGSIPARIEAAFAEHLLRTGRLEGQMFWGRVDTYLAKNIGQGVLWDQYEQATGAKRQEAWIRAHNRDLLAAWDRYSREFYLMPYEDRQMALAVMCIPKAIHRGFLASASAASKAS